MKAANDRQNLYSTVAAPYLSAKRTLELYEGYNDIDSIISEYDKTVAERTARLEAERAEQEKLDAERKLDKERYEAEKKLRKRK